MNHVMVDLETLDTTPSSVILSAGLVVYNSSAGGLLERMHVVFDPDDQLRRGRTAGIRTLAWWMDQSPEARAVFEIAEHGASLEHGLMAIREYFERVSPLCVWGNGADFDIAILASAYATLGQPTPWNFYDVRCYRTLKSIYPHIEKPDHLHAVPHNALDDAVLQAHHLQNLLEEHERCISHSLASTGAHGSVRTRSPNTSSLFAGGIATG